MYKNTTPRRADAKDTTGTDYDTTPTTKYHRDIAITSCNADVFAENIFRNSNKFIVIPGSRYEWLQCSDACRNGFASTGLEIILQNIKRSRSFLLAGFGSEYNITKNTIQRCK